MARTASRALRRSCVTRRVQMPSKMTAEQYATEHGAAMVEWLRDNTVECACALPFGCDENHRTGGKIDADTEILCRRCFVPFGL